MRHVSECGLGFVASLRGDRCRDVVERGLRMLPKLLLVLLLILLLALHSLLLTLPWLVVHLQLTTH